VKEISRRKKNWSSVPDGRLTPRQTGRLTVGRKLTSTSTSMSRIVTIITIYHRHKHIESIKLLG
jgi:hypothetical protein